LRGHFKTEIAREVIDSGIFAGGVSEMLGSAGPPPFEGEAIRAFCKNETRYGGLGLAETHAERAV